MNDYHIACDMRVVDFTMSLFKQWLCSPFCHTEGKGARLPRRLPILGVTSHHRTRVSIFLHLEHDRHSMPKHALTHQVDTDSFDIARFHKGLHRFLHPAIATNER